MFMSGTQREDRGVTHVRSTAGMLSHTRPRLRLCVMFSCWSVAQVMLVVSPGALLLAGGFVATPPLPRCSTIARSLRSGAAVSDGADSRDAVRRRPQLYSMSVGKYNAGFSSKGGGSAAAAMKEVDESALQHLEGATKPVKARVSASATLPPESTGEDGLEHIVVATGDNNAPIDWILSRRMPVNSRRYYRKEIEVGGVKVNGKVVKTLVRVAAGSTISVKVGTSAGATVGASGLRKQKQLLFPQHIPTLKVLHEDKHFFVVQKPAGMVCQPCEGAKKGTVLHGLLHHMVDSGQVRADDMEAARRLSQGIVHRLDKYTSGVMIVAKTLEASSKFSNLFKDGKVKKEYLAICHGDPGRDTLVDAPLYRRSSGKVAAVRKEEAEQYGARETITRIRNVATIGGVSLCKAEILTGRMHQARVHLQWRGCPVVGDKEYGDFAANERVSRRSHNRIVAKRPLLHSMSLEFVHPITKKAMTFRSAMPNDMWEVASHILRSGTSAQRREFKNLQELRLMTPDEEAAAEARAVQNQRRATSADRAGRFRKGQGPGKNLGAQAAAAAVSSLGLKTKPP